MRRECGRSTAIANGFGELLEERRGSRAIVRALRQLELCHGDAIHREAGSNAPACRCTPRIRSPALTIKTRLTATCRASSMPRSEALPAKWPALLQRLDQVRPCHCNAGARPKTTHDAAARRVA